MNSRSDGPSARPRRIRDRGFADSFQCAVNFGDEFIAKARASFVVPARGAAKLGARFSV